MSTGSNQSTAGGSGNSLSEEENRKIDEVRRLIGPVPYKLLLYCSDASISRYLRARNWNVKKASKMLKETIKWRLEYKPEEICWDDVAGEAETGKIYRSCYVDRRERPVLVMRPRCQNSKSAKGQIKYLVYCMENAILNLPVNQEQMVWLIDFHGFSLSHISIRVTRDTARVLQQHYPERLGVAILFDPPKFFEPFWKAVKPILEQKTADKVKFVYSNNANTNRIMGDLFDMDKLERAFGGSSDLGFDINEYAKRMREDDTRMPSFWSCGSISHFETAPPLNPTAASSGDCALTVSQTDISDEKSSASSSQGVDAENISFLGVDAEEISSHENLPAIDTPSAEGLEDVKKH